LNLQPWDDGACRDGYKGVTVPNSSEDLIFVKNNQLSIRKTNWRIRNKPDGPFDQDEKVQ
jgi:hypothetical protein